MKVLLSMLCAFKRLAPVMAIVACLLSGLSGHAAVTYYHHDLLGSPIAATDESGAVVWEKTYRPYGSEYEDGGVEAEANRIGYTGHRLDRDLGLLYAGGRYIDTELGRFTGMDLVGYQEAYPGSFNRYAYANNNPYRYVDPDGNIFFVPILVFVAKELATAAIEYGIKETTGLDVPLSMKGLVKSGLKSATTALAKRKANDAGVVTNVAKNADGIVYKRTNPITGDSYVGQSKSPDRFSARQGEHNRDLGVQHDFEIIGRAEPGRNLDVLEESKIRELGGIQKRGGSLQNKRHQMSEKRYRDAGGTKDKPY